eukprot:TRINITY_DN3718_c0_g1_i4.p1 TRINITY_DN3718_c0_g1~~TRINITY_DN3718_c0_g1_i4.p1  ORF type:complete len:402 (-),score=53.21 TRINITY_DN3718_c0_g1_i4:108-1313(-)
MCTALWHSDDLCLSVLRFLEACDLVACMTISRAFHFLCHTDCLWAWLYRFQWPDNIDLQQSTAFRNYKYRVVLVRELSVSVWQLVCGGEEERQEFVGHLQQYAQIYLSPLLSLLHAAPPSVPALPPTHSTTRHTSAVQQAALYPQLVKHALFIVNEHLILKGWSSMSGLWTWQQPQILLKGAALVARIGIPDVDEDALGQHIVSLANQVAHLLQALPPGACGDMRCELNCLREVLYVQHGFRGNNVNYYQPDNSYLPRVLLSKQGLPITLSLLYLAVAAHLQPHLHLQLRGIGAPRHFLLVAHSTARPNLPPAPLFIDPFHEARILSEEDVLRMFEGVVSDVAELLSYECSPRQLFLRMHRNLISCSVHHERALAVSAFHALAGDNTMENDLTAFRRDYFN